MRLALNQYRHSSCQTLSRQLALPLLAPGLLPIHIIPRAPFLTVQSLLGFWALSAAGNLPSAGSVATQERNNIEEGERGKVWHPNCRLLLAFGSKWPYRSLQEEEQEAQTGYQIPRDHFSDPWSVIDLPCIASRRQATASTHRTAQLLQLRLSHCSLALLVGQSVSLSARTGLWYWVSPPSLLPASQRKSKAPSFFACLLALVPGRQHSPD